MCDDVSDPARARQNYLSQRSGSSQYAPWGAGPVFPQVMHNKCDPDVTFDAVSTLGDATFFFRERYADDLIHSLVVEKIACSCLL